MDKIDPAPVEFSADQIAADPVLYYFHYAHLPSGLREISEAFCSLAGFIIDALPRNAERSVALRKLLEAKDAGVRANVGQPDTLRLPETFETRLIAEHKDLLARFNKLSVFIDTAGPFDTLPAEQKELLVAQRKAMADYVTVLEHRMSLLGLVDDARTNYSTHDAGDRDEILETRVTGGGSEETPIPFKG